MTKPDEARIAWNACAAARFEDEENGNPLGLPQGMPNFDDFKDGYRAGAAASEARIKELEGAIRDANKRLKDYSDMTVDQWGETVADGGITAWMVIRQELQTVIAGGLARALLKESDQ